MVVIAILIFYVESFRSSVIARTITREPLFVTWLENAKRPNKSN